MFDNCVSGIGVLCSGFRVYRYQGIGWVATNIKQVQITILIRWEIKAMRPEESERLEILKRKAQGHEGRIGYISLLKAYLQTKHVTSHSLL